MAALIRATCAARLQNCRNSIAALRRAGSAREHHPHPAAGAGRRVPGVGAAGSARRPTSRTRAGGSPSFSSLICQLPPRNIAASPAIGRRRSAADSRCAQHRARRRAALDRVAQEARARRASRSRCGGSPKTGRPSRIDELAALRPEHRQVIEDGRLPSGRRCRGSRRCPLARDAARRARAARPRCAAASAPDPCGRRARGSRSRATCRRRGPARSDSVLMVNGRKSARSSPGQYAISGCRCPPSRNSGSQKLSIDATSGRRPAAAASSSFALCSSSPGITEMSSCMSGCAPAQSSKIFVNTAASCRAGPRGANTPAAPTRCTASGASAAADAHRRHQFVGLPGARHGEKRTKNQQGAGQQPRRAASRHGAFTVTHTGLVMASGAPSGAKKWART